MMNPSPNWNPKVNRRPTPIVEAMRAAPMRGAATPRAAGWIGTVAAFALLWFGVASAALAQPVPGAIGPTPTPEEELSFIEKAEREAAAEEEKKPLYQREPFDVIQLDESNANAVIRVIPLERPLPKNPSPTKLLQFTRVDQRNRKYEVPWKNVVKITLFEEMMLEQANALTGEGKFDEAYPFFDFLLSNYANATGFEDGLNNYLLANAVSVFKDQKYIEMFSMLEELRQSNPQFRPDVVLRGIDQAIGALLQQHMDANNIHATQALITRLERSYKDSDLPSMVKWRNELIRLASIQRDAAQKAMDAGEMREAYKRVQEMLRVYPKVPGGVALANEVAGKHPMVYVGVSQPARVYEPNRIDNWAARRSGRLLHRMLLEFRKPGPEGGEYVFSLGQMVLREDRQQLQLTLNPPSAGEPASYSAYDAARRLVDLASLSHPDYSPSWASLVAQVQVTKVFNVTVDFTRPHVLPQSMLLTRMGDDDAGPQLTIASPAAGAMSTVPPGAAGRGPYALVLQTEQESQFLMKSSFTPSAPTQPKEVVERYFADGEDAKQALLRGDVDVLDQLYPADATKLAGRSDLVVGQYAMPQVHLLIPVSEHPYLANRNFRRALIYGIDRQAILHKELLNEMKAENCQVVSGPFPAGRDRDDPMGYAYDSTVEPLPYNPRLAFALAVTAQIEVKKQAEKKGEKVGDMIEGIPLPNESEEEAQLSAEERKQLAEKKEAEKKIPPARAIVIGYPSNEIARVACHAIQQQLTAVKIRCEVKELPPGLTEDPEGKCDLLYATAGVWEPIADARRVLGPEGLARSNNPYISLQLRKLESARSWKEVQDALHDLHRRVGAEMTVMPLWQMTDFFAYRRSLGGIGDSPVALYQNINNWTVVPQVRTN